VTGAGVAEVTNQLLYDDEVGYHAVRALHDLARADDDRPFCLVASFTHPHDPYVTRQQYWDRYDHDSIPMPRQAQVPEDDDPHSVRLRGAIDSVRTAVTEADVRNARHAYYGNVAYCDDWAANLLETLNSLGLADNTVVMVVADHGDMLGERGLWYKMNFFEGSARIPLIIHSPSRFAHARVAQPVSLVDVLPTLCELAGVGELAAESLGARQAGQSLLGLCEGTDEARTVFGQYMAEGSVAPIVMQRTGNLKYIHCPADPDQLYDLDADAEERANLALLPEYATIAAQFRAEVNAQFNLEQIRQDVIADQASRRLIDTANRIGQFTPWDYSPPRNASQEYMRNHLDLNDVERLARWPRNSPESRLPAS
jgi:choline-sulfatase